MAKVISQGLFRYEHKACKSVIEFALSELKDGYHTDYLGDRDYFRSLVCPGCGGTIMFPKYGTPC